MVVRNPYSIEAHFLSFFPSFSSLVFLYFFFIFFFVFRLHFCDIYISLCMHNVRKVVSVPVLCKSSIDTETTLFCRSVNADLFMLLIFSLTYNK